MGGDYGEYFPGVYLNNTYKTIHIVGDGYGYLFSRWCTDDVELYDTVVMAPFFLPQLPFGSSS